MWIIVGRILLRNLFMCRNRECWMSYYWLRMEYFHNIHQTDNLSLIDSQISVIIWVYLSARTAPNIDICDNHLSNILIIWNNLSVCCRYVIWYRRRNVVVYVVMRERCEECCGDQSLLKMYLIGWFEWKFDYLLDYVYGDLGTWEMLSCGISEFTRMDFICRRVVNDEALLNGCYVINSSNLFTWVYCSGHEVVKWNWLTSMLLTTS